MSVLPQYLQTLTRRLYIHGQVQGVGYRWSMVAQAQLLGLSGWVRNCRDGTVEAVVTGPADAVQDLIAWAQHGPPQAVVQRVDVRPLAEDEDTPTLAGFEQRPTV